MYICDKCHDTVERLPIDRYYHDVAGNSSVSGYIEEADDECSCGGIYVEAEECKACGDIYPALDLSEGLCENCIKERTTLKNVIAYAKDRNCIYELLTEYLFDKENVTAILLDVIEKAGEDLGYLLGNRVKDACQNFVNDDLGDFADFLKKSEGLE